MMYKIQDEFKTRYGEGASLYASPGRVNLIGEHTDYNLGFVLPGAIDKSIYIAIKPNGGSISRLYSSDYGVALDVDMNGAQPKEQWASFLYGVVQEMKKRGATVPAFDCVFGGDVPLGAGLSSSAALESVTGFALNDMYNLGFDRETLAVIGQMTEHNYIGVKCGIMDQFASLFGEKGKVIRLDCRSLEYELTPFNPIGVKVVLIDSMVKHSLASSEYNTRRAQCEAGVSVIEAHVTGIASLRDVTMDMLNRYKSEMDEIVYRRCSYVIEENQRLIDGCQALKDSNYALFGEKMFGSHQGLSLDYEVSCKELDFIANIAGKTSGVLGARMMGGGFGGCVINLVTDSAYESYIDDVKGKFAHEFKVEPRIIDVVIGDGARKLEL